MGGYSSFGCEVLIGGWVCISGAGRWAGLWLVIEETGARWHRRTGMEYENTKRKLHTKNWRIVQCFAIL